ncbi:MAG: DUF4178 domain-containing protein [Patescibacteria group bacterium]
MDSTQHARLGIIRSVQRSRLVPLNARFNPDFSKILPGAVVSLSGKTYSVFSVSHYDEQSWNFKKDEKFRVHEWGMTCFETGETCWFEWEKDDTVSAYLSSRKLESSDLGITDWKSFLHDDRLDSSLKLRFDGVTYSYDDEESWAAKYYRDGTGDPQFVRSYEFGSKGPEGLTVEVWGKDGSGGVEIWLSKPVPASAPILIAYGS